MIADLDQFIDLDWTEKWRRHGAFQLRLDANTVPADVLPFITTGNAALHAIREWERPREDGTVEKVSDEVHGPILFHDLDADQELWDLRGNDDKIWTAWRFVDTDTFDRIDLGSITAIAYIRAMLNSELIAPSLAIRQIDIPVVLAGSTVGGALVDLPVRWKRLDDVIESACLLGDVGFQSVLDGTTVEFSALLSKDRTTGGIDTVIMNKDNTDAIVRSRTDYRGVRNRIVVLGQGTGSGRTVVTRSDAASQSLLGTREHVVDARHVNDTPGLNDRGDTELAERVDTADTLEVLGAERTFDVRPGDRITVEEYARADSTSPDIGPLDVLCVARTIRLSPNSEDAVRLQVGAEQPTSEKYTMAVEKRGQDAAFE